MLAIARLRKQAYAVNVRHEIETREMRERLWHGLDLRKIATRLT